MGKKVVDAKADAKGNITAVKLAGNAGFTSLETAMRMADKGLIDNAHTVNRGRSQAAFAYKPERQDERQLGRYGRR